MLIRFFRSSFLMQYVVLALIGVGLWLPAILEPSAPMAGTSAVTPLYNILTGYLPDIGWLPPLAALIFVMAEAVILNNIFIYHDLAAKNSLLPSFLFILFMSSGVSGLTLYPALIALLPMTFFTHQLYQLYEEEENLNKMLGVGLLASISSMIYAPLLLLIFFIWFTFLIYRTLHLREWIIALIGFAIPYLYLLVYYFWMETLATNTLAYLDYFMHIFQLQAIADILQLTIWAIFALLMLFPAILRVASSLGSHNIAFRRKMSLTVWMGILGIFTIVLQGQIGNNTLVYLPATGIVVYYFQSMKKPFWNEVVLLAYLVLIAIQSYIILE